LARRPTLALIENNLILLSFFAIFVEMGDVWEILTFSQLDGTEVLEEFIRRFRPWERRIRNLETRLAGKLI
jgi:hypothetical protein